ncbi:MAG: LysM peptidoglycan-binding domain-containing protein [Prevotellaceae bacterium]|jgi:LysM repeat protein/ABC-type branched-subunit amino acid transport system substrate-binding protein|nr:LysM peptidoglycan-binding domain-containing protein [Prevotellaceae bacterium]
MKKSSKIICALLLAAFCAVSHAQVPVQKSTEKTRINGKVYYIHVVQKGQTLYSLSKAYGVTIQQLTENNPDLSGGLKEGQSIRIPVLASELSAPPAPTSGAPAKEPAKEPAKVSARPAYHLVKPGETLPDIADKYEVPAATLQQLNPEAFFKGKLQPGTLLQIPPAAGEKITGAVADTASARDVTGMQEALYADTSLYYTVQPQETLWGIAKRYHTTVQELRRLNPTAFVNEELQTGAILQLHALVETPVYRDLEAAPAGLPAQPFTGTVKVALLLPLLRDMDDTLTARSKSPENFFSFYEGALLAIENLKQEGLSLELSVYDSFYDKDVEALLQRGVLQQQDIIIGPVYADNFKPVAQLAKEYRIKIVSPLDPHTEEQTIDNPYVWQLSPPAYCRQKKLTDHVLAQKQANIILIYHEDGREALLMQEYKHLLGERMDSVKMLAHQVVKGAAVRDTLEKLLVEDKMNCVLVASHDDALVSDIAANLYLFTFRNRYNITLYGTERWRNFETVDIKYLHTLNLHLVVPFFVDYSAERVQKFVAGFYEKYKTDPSQYAFQGYDTFDYFLRAIMRYGKNFEDYLPAYNPQLLQTKYRFKYNGNSANGLVNVESCLIRYTPGYSIEKQ